MTEELIIPQVPLGEIGDKLQDYDLINFINISESQEAGENRETWSCSVTCLGHTDFLYSGKGTRIQRNPTWQLVSPVFSIHPIPEEGSLVQSMILHK